MARVLTKSEIDQLYDFVAVKDIPYYDVQSEIVDHLASLMEDRWAKGSQLNLEQMFLEVYKEFGEPENIYKLGGETIKYDDLVALFNTLEIEIHDGLL